MEHGFGHDLGAVRIHDGPVAAAAARSVGANALALGHHIVFDAEQCRPSQGEGRRLLAHELTHVLQQSSGAQPALQAQRSRFSREADTPSMGFTCTLQEMDDANFDGRSCCDERVLGQLRTMVNDARAHMRTAIERIDGGASIDALLQLHFGPSGPSSRGSILANIRATLGVADAFLSRHTFLCRPLSDRFGCTGVEAARAAEDTDITVCLGGGTVAFGWATILHEMFHVSGVADLHVYGETATAAEEAAGEFETYYAPQGAEMEESAAGGVTPRPHRCATPTPIAGSWRRFRPTTGCDTQPSARFAPTLAAGFGIAAPRTETRVPHGAGGVCAPLAAACISSRPAQLDSGRRPWERCPPPIRLPRRRAVMSVANSGLAWSRGQESRGRRVRSRQPARAQRGRGAVPSIPPRWSAVRPASGLADRHSVGA